MMGSANLTQAGILARTEMGIVVDEPKMIAEMCAWFETLWAGSTSPMVDETSVYIAWLDEEASRRPAHRQRFALSSSSRSVRARLASLPANVTAVSDARNALNLSAVAHSIIAQDQKRYASLAEAMDDAVDV